MNMTKHMSPAKRRTLLQERLGIKLPLIANASYKDTEEVHCENLIGATTIPLGVAGPLEIAGGAVRGEKFIPLATTEGALVASVNRGCKVIGASGGVRVHVENKGITRGPVFMTGSVEKGIGFKRWIEKHAVELSRVSAETSSHLRLLGIEVKPVGMYAFLRLSFDTGQAMGMNMATIASAAIVDFIRKETGIGCISLSGNYCVDKKASWLNALNGRGREAWAEVVIPEAVVSTILKTTPQNIYGVWLSKNMLGSAMSGSMGFNGHFANIVAALYAATGQDLAHVVEGSLGITVARVLEDGNLYFSVYMPSIVAGTVGGGTKLAIKKEALSILQITSSDEFAESMVAAVLAGELSLLASLAEGTLASTHRKLGR